MAVGSSNYDQAGAGNNGCLIPSPAPAPSTPCSPSCSSRSGNSSSPGDTSTTPSPLLLFLADSGALLLAANTCRSETLSAHFWGLSSAAFTSPPSFSVDTLSSSSPTVAKKPPSAASWTSSPAAGARVGAGAGGSQPRGDTSWSARTLLFVFLSSFRSGRHATFVVVSVSLAEQIRCCCASFARWWIQLYPVSARIP